MTERNPVTVTVLMFLTCGLYSFHYMYATTRELVAITGRDDVDPRSELLINLITCGVYGMYAEYRNQQIIDAWFAAREIPHEPKAQVVGVMNLLAFVVYLTAFVSTFVYQSELNAMIARGAGASADPATDASRAPVAF
ncbi:MAG TPA: DUF4234 domain-containing protein [Sandaracinaceae bacterium LLY-WYZ-13_1]|nr:DUF4234 domain-containing protein [Sandaracinaceae bacterium LLY-WYZ-13_1]